MPKNKSYEDLQVWHKSIALCKQIYVITRSFPREEVYGLTSQMRRCAVSIASNIAEGCSRNNKGEFRHFLGIASGSAAELKTQLIIACEIELLTKDAANPLIEKTDEIERMLTGLTKSLERKPSPPYSQLATRPSQLEPME